MSRKRYTPEQIIAKLREVEVRLSQGEKVGGISRSTFYYTPKDSVPGLPRFAA